MINVGGMRVKRQLVLFSCIMLGGFVLFGLISFHSISKIKVNGPIYKNIVQNKDLIADILPPPQYIIESYLTVFQAANDPDISHQDTYLQKFGQLRKEFDERHEYWQNELSDGPMKEIIIKKSHDPAVMFYATAEKELFPAIASRDAIKISNALKDLRRYYEIHRQAIDELVAMADKQSKADEAAAAETMRMETILLAVIMLTTLLTATIMAYMITSNLLRRIGGEPHAIAEIADKVAHGDLTVAFNSSGMTTGICASMADMVAGLKELALSIKADAQSLAASSRQLSAGAEQMSHGVANQFEQTSQIAASASEMSRTINDVAQNASLIALEASGTHNQANEGKEIVAQSVKESKAITAVVEKSSQKIIALSDQSRKIGEIVNVIKDIADQTNLLALNAAIEAARAGEQGRGFAVVADEVRKLAERTSSATAEIAEIISAIQQGIESAADSMSETTQRVINGGELSGKAQIALDAIASNIEKLQEKVCSIAGATEEMSKTAECISLDIGNISRVTEETSSGAAEIARESADLSKLAVELQNQTVKFKL